MIDFKTQVLKTTINVMESQREKDNLTICRQVPTEVDLLDVTMLSRIRDRNDLADFAERLFPHIVKTMSYNKHIAVRVHLEKDLDFVLRWDCDEIDVHNALVREYKRNIEAPNMTEEQEDEMF